MYTAFHKTFMFHSSGSFQPYLSIDAATDGIVIKALQQKQSQRVVGGNGVKGLVALETTRSREMEFWVMGSGSMESWVMGSGSMESLVMGSR